MFLFGTLDGTIAAWNAASGTHAITVVDSSSNHASYTGIALDTNSTGTFLLAADFALGTVDVFGSNFANATLAGRFADPNIPTGYSPFGIHSIGTNVYITYAQRNSSNGAYNAGAGLGYVDVFDNNGNLVKSQAISQSVLNAPWGMALAPMGFGSFGGDLLVGNFGDGVINAFNPTTFALAGSLNASTGSPIANPGLWEIFFGQGGNVGDTNTLYFSASINNQLGGLFGSIAVAPPAAGTPDFSFQSSSNSLSVTPGQTGNVTLSLAATNGFSGPVTFSCSGLPNGAACTFTPASVTLSGSGTTTVAAAISTPAAPPPASGGGYVATHSVHSLRSHTGLALAFIGPVGLLVFAGLKRRSILARGSLFALLLVVASAAISGCSSSSTGTGGTVVTPGTSQVTINATSGSITHNVTVALTVQ